MFDKSELDRLISTAVKEGNHEEFAKFYYKNAKLVSELYKYNLCKAAGVTSVNNIYDRFKVNKKYCCLVNKTYWNDPKYMLSEDKLDISALYQKQSLKKSVPSREAIIQLGLLLQQDRRTVDKWLLDAEQSMLYLLETQDLVCAYYLEKFAREEKDSSIEGGYRRIVQCKNAMNHYLEKLAEKSEDLHIGLKKGSKKSAGEKLTNNIVYSSETKNEIKYLVEEKESIEGRIERLEDLGKDERAWLWDVMTHFSNMNFELNITETDFDSYINKEIEENIVFSRRYGLFRAYFSLYEKSIKQEKQYWKNVEWPLYESDDSFSLDKLEEYRSELRLNFEDLWDKSHKGDQADCKEVADWMKELVEKDASKEMVSEMKKLAENTETEKKELLELILENKYQVKERGKEIKYFPKQNAWDGALKGWSEWKKR